MTQDCLNSPSTADVSYCLPKGIHVTGADDKSDPAIEGMAITSELAKVILGES